MKTIRRFTWVVVVLGVAIGLAVGALSGLLIGKAIADETVVRVVPTTTTTDVAHLIPPISMVDTTTTLPGVRHDEYRPDLHAAGQVDGYPCGGDLPDCWVLRHEGPGGRPDPAVWNGSCYYAPGYAGANPCGSTASGLWQFLRSTWAGFGGYLNAADAPVDVQNQKARIVWANGAGCSSWSAC